MWWCLTGVKQAGKAAEGQRDCVRVSVCVSGQPTTTTILLLLLSWSSKYLRTSKDLAVYFMGPHTHTHIHAQSPVAIGTVTVYYG